MRRSAKSLVGIACSMAWMAVAWAQLPPNLPLKWWNNARVIKELGLNSQQIQKIEAIWLENRRKLIDFRAEHDKLQLDVDALVAKPVVDETTLRTKVDMLYKAKADLEKTTLLMRLGIRDVLTPEQQERSLTLFEELRQELQEKRNAGEGTESSGARGARPKTPPRIPPTSTLPASKAPPKSQ